jgi:hypothetical protein
MEIVDFLPIIRPIISGLEMLDSAVFGCYSVHSAISADNSQLRLMKPRGAAEVIPSALAPRSWPGIWIRRTAGMTSQAFSGS